MESSAFSCFDLEQTVQSIAGATGVAARHARAAIELLEDGNTLPFIARYRKETTGGLDETTLRTIEDALAKGARLLLGGKPLDDRDGHFYAPTALRDATPDMALMHEETFGPVAAFVTFREEDDLVARVNHATYGLTGYCYTRDLSRAFRMASAFRCGFVGSSFLVCRL